MGIDRYDGHGHILTMAQQSHDHSPGNDRSHHHSHDHDRSHNHGNPIDRKLGSILRYVKNGRRMWSSVVNDAIVDAAAPTTDETALDIGAGMGPAVMRAAARGAHVIAVDPTPFMRRVMQARLLVNRNRSKVDVVDGASEALPVPDASIDVTWSVNTMHHWSDTEAAAAEIVRVLAPGGRVLLWDENFADPSHPFHEKWVERHGHGGGHDDHDGGHDHHHHGFSMVDASEIGALFSTAGLVDVDAEERIVAGRPVICVSGRKP